VPNICQVLAYVIVKKIMLSIWSQFFLSRNYGACGDTLACGWLDNRSRNIVLLNNFPTNPRTKTATKFKWRSNHFWLINRSKNSDTRCEMRLSGSSILASDRRGEYSTEMNVSARTKLLRELLKSVRRDAAGTVQCSSDCQFVFENCHAVIPILVIRK